MNLKLQMIHCKILGLHAQIKISRSFLHIANIYKIMGRRNYSSGFHPDGVRPALIFEFSLIPQTESWIA